MGARLDESSRAVRSVDTMDMPPALWNLAAVVFLYMSTVAVMGPVYPALILEALGGDDGKAAEWQGMLTLMKNLLELMLMPLVGSFSDHNGRKPVMVLALVILVGESVCVAIWPTLMVISVMKVLGGVTNATILMAHSCTADISHGAPTSQAAKNFGMLGGAMGFAFCLGPVTGGYLAKIDGLQVPCILSAAVAVLTLVFVLLRVKETLMEECDYYKGIEDHSGNVFLPSSGGDGEEESDGESLSRSRHSSTGSVHSLKRAVKKEEKKRSLNPLRGLMELGKLPGLRALLGPYFLATVAMTAYSVFYMYCDFRYHWTPLDVGMFMTLGGLGAGIHQGLTVRVVIPALVSEEQAASGGYLLHAFSMVMFGTASQGYMIYVATILLGVHQVADPAMVALMTAIPGPDHKGALQGALLSVRTLAHAVGAPVFGAIFAWCISTDFIKRHGRPLPGAPFLLASAILFITSTLCQRVFYNQRAKKRNDEKLREEAKPLLKDEMQYAAGKAELA